MSKFITLWGHLDLSGNFGQSAITTNMGSSESKFAGVNNIPFANTAIFAINSIIKSSEYVHYFNSKWLGMTSPHVVIVNNNNLRNESNYDREHVSGRNLHESFANHNMKLGDEYRITESQDPVNYSSQEGDSNEAEARILDRCWALADQLTSVNPVASRLSVKTNLIDFNFEIENGNLSLFIDGNAIVGDTGEIDLVEDDIEKREVAIREELDDESHDANAIIDNNFDDVNKQKKRKTLVSFDLDDETCVFYKSCSEFSGPNDDFVMSEDEEEEERMREHRLDLLKEQLMSTLQGPKCDEDCKSSVVEICAKIEEEINTSRRAVSVASEYSELIEDTEDTGVTRRARDTRSYNSRRSSTDSSEDGFNQNVRDLKQEVKDLEEKFRKAMVANASLDNEKCQLMFQVDLLKDQVEEGEEQAALVVKELRAKTHDYEILKRDHAESVRAVQLLQQALNEQQAMLQERGLVLLGEGDEGEGEQDCDEMEQEKRTRAIVSQDTANILAGLGSGPLDVRIKRLAGQRDDLQDTVRRLKLDLEEERSRSSLARGAASMDEIERETKKLLDDYKFKISKSDQEIATLGANVARLESQVIRYKTASETAELSEENLKVERRKMQRELRDAVTRNEELETQNKHLEKRLDKLKTAKSNLLKEL